MLSIPIAILHSSPAPTPSFTTSPSIQLLPRTSVCIKYLDKQIRTAKTPSQQSIQSDTGKTRQGQVTHVVLRSNSPVKVLVEEGELLQDIPTHTRNFTEEEERKDTNAHAEGTGNGATICPLVKLVQFAKNAYGSVLGEDLLFHGSARVKAVKVEGSVVPALLLVVSSSFLHFPSQVQAIDDSFHPLDKPGFRPPASIYPPVSTTKELKHWGISHLGERGEDMAAARRTVWEKTYMIKAAISNWFLSTAIHTGCDSRRI